MRKMKRSVLAKRLYRIQLALRKGPMPVVVLADELSKISLDFELRRVELVND